MEKPQSDQPELHPGELEFRLAVDSSIDGITIASLEGDILYINEAQARMHGYASDELVGRHVSVLNNPQIPMDQVTQYVMNEGHWHGENTGVRKDGSTFPMRQTVSRVDDTNGRPTAILAITRDISEEKDAEDRLRLRTQQLAALLSASREINSSLSTTQVMRSLVRRAMSLVSASGGTAGLYVDGRMVVREYNLQGHITPIDYSFESGYGIPGWVITHRKAYLSDDARADPNVIPEIQQAIGFVRLVDVPIIGSDGSLLGCFELHNPEDKAPFTREDVKTLTGLANQAAVALANATMAESIRRNAETIRKHEEALRMLVEGSPDFFFYVHNTEGVFTYVSPSVEHITGYKPDHWMAHYTQFLTDNPINREVIAITENTLKTGETRHSYPVEIYHKDGHRITLEVFERPIWDEGKVTGIRGVARDVTQLLQAEEQNRRFYRDTIFSVTDGKLVVCNQEEISGLCCASLFEPVSIAQPQDVTVARNLVRLAAQEAGMDPTLVDDFLLCVGEAATNAYKHGGGGTLAMCECGDALRVRITDHGPGMDSLALPKLTLMKGYSTGKSLGMGYATILSLASKVYLSTGTSGTTVSIEMPKQPVASALDLANLPDFW